MLTWSSGSSCGHKTEGSRVGGVLEYVSWPCIGAQLKDVSYVVIWTACKPTHNQYKTISVLTNIILLR